MKRPAIKKPNLLWRKTRTGVWRPYYRVTWVEGGKQRSREIVLDWKGDPQELDRLYWLARGGRHEAQKTPQRYTWGECVKAWSVDPIKGRGALADSTRASYQRPINHIIAKNAGRDMRTTKRQAVRDALAKLQDTPRKASRYAQTISLLWNYARRELDWPLGDNPAAGLATYKAARPYEPWPAWMIDKVPTAPASVQAAVALILGTGQRPSAAIAMRWDQFDGEWMEVTDEKAGLSFVTYCPQRLRDALDAMPRTGAHVLARNLTEPLGYDAVQKAFSRWRAGLGAKAKAYSLHGLRKLAIIELAEAGATDAEIQAVTDQSLEIINYYRANADRKLLSRAAQKRRT